jgi:hypothetical protein
MKHAGSDHGAAVPGRIAHFFDIIADKLVGGFRMPGIDLAHIAHEIQLEAGTLRPMNLAMSATKALQLNSSTLQVVDLACS